jgi:hypothetical protein
MNITPAKSAPAPAIIEPERDNPPVVLSEGLALLQVIERASRDPNVDIDKMERLIAMRERMRLVDAETQFSAALAEMQDELPVIEEHGKIDIGRGKPQAYALWEDINEAIKPVLAKHGFSLSFKTGEAENRVTVTGVLRHRAGHREETTMKLPIDTSGSKNAVQAVGSSTSYGKPPSRGSRRRRQRRRYPAHQRTADGRDPIADRRHRHRHRQVLRVYEG